MTYRSAFSSLFPLTAPNSADSLSIYKRTHENLEKYILQGPRSNFEMGGEAPLVTQYWGGAQDTFSY